MGSIAKVKRLVPDYEVKLLMEPEKVLDGEGKLKDGVISEFNIDPDTKKMLIQFIDTHGQLIHKNNWNLRIRKLDGDSMFGLTYKKRFPVVLSINTELAANIDVAGIRAHGQGFGESSSVEAQVEVGHTKQSLSISYSDKASAKDYDGTDLPHTKDTQDAYI